MFKFHFYDTNKRVDNTRLNQLLKVATRPDIPSAEEIIEETTLGDGTVVHKHTGIYKEREIEVECNFVQKNKELWNNHFSEIQNILLGKRGNLIFSDDTFHYWIVNKVSIDKAKRKFGIVASFTIKFICEPYRYLMKFREPFTIDIKEDLFNVTILNEHQPSEPLWRISGSSDITEISIRRLENDSEFIIYNPFEKGDKTIDHIDIDIEKWTCMTYYTDGTFANTGTKTSGFHDDLKLRQEENNFVVSKNGTSTLHVELFERLREF